MKIPVKLMLWLQVLIALSLAAPLSAAETWQKVMRPHFTIYTNASPAAVDAWGRYLDGTLQLLQRVFPIDDRLIEPVDVLLFKDRRGMLLPSRRIAFNQAGFVSSDGSNMIVAFDGKMEEPTLNRTNILHGLVHSYFNSFRTRPPYWLEEGVAQIFSTLHLENNRAVFDRMTSDRNSIPSISLSMLLAQGIGPYHPPDRRHALSQILVAYMLTQEGLAGMAKLNDFSARAAAGEPLDGAFSSVFSKSFEQMEAELRSFAAKPVTSITGLPSLAAPAAGTIQVSVASADEVDFQKGELLVLNGMPTDAAPIFQQLVARSPNNPRGHEGMGAVAAAMGDRTTAIACYTKAVELGSTDFRARLFAQMDSVKLIVAQAMGGDSVDPALVRKVVEAVKQLARLRPSFVEGDVMVASLLGLVDTVSDDDDQYMQGALQRHPDTPIIICGMAVVEMKTGRMNEARARLGALTLDGSGTDTKLTREYVVSLRQSLWVMRDLEAARKDYDDGEIVRCRERLDNIKGQQLLPVQRQAYNQLVKDLAIEDVFALVREAIEKKQFDLAETWLGDLKADDLRPRTVKVLDELKGKVAAGKSPGGQ